MPINVKICGLRDHAGVDAALQAGARYIGFVFFEKSPRNIRAEHAAQLGAKIPSGVCKTALVVNASDNDLDQLVKSVPIDMLQLHGTESTKRVQAIKARYGLPVMKAIGIADENDLDAIAQYSHVADQLLIDAKAPKNTTRPGGNGLAFDWRLLAGRRWALPWMLAGGLTSENVVQAIMRTGATQVDVSSGVEDNAGVKSPQKIANFITRALSAPAVLK